MRHAITALSALVFVMIFSAVSPATAQTVENLPPMTEAMADTLEKKFPLRVIDGQIHYGKRPESFSEKSYDRNTNVYSETVELLGFENLRADSLQLALGGALALVDSLQSENDRLQFENDSLRQQLLLAQSQVNQLREELNAANGRIDGLFVELEVVNTRLERIEKLVEENNAMLKQLTAWKPQTVRFDFGAGYASLLEYNFHDRPETDGLALTTSLLVGNPNKVGAMGYASASGVLSFDKHTIDPNGPGQQSHPNGFEEKTSVNGHYVHGSLGGMLNLPLAKAENENDAYCAIQVGLGGNGLEHTRPGRQNWTGSYGLEAAGGFIMGNHDMEFRFLASVVLAGNTHDPQMKDDAFSGFSLKLAGLFFEKHVGFVAGIDAYNTRQPDTTTYEPWERGESGFFGAYIGANLSF